MNPKRIAWLVAGGGAVAVWLAGAATIAVRPPQTIIAPKPAAIDRQGEALAAEITRLHERLRPTATPVQSRDLFRYASRAVERPGALPVAAPPPAPIVEPMSTPALKLVGIAEDAGPDGPSRTAIVSTAGALVFAREGEAVSQYRVTKIAADAVELTNVDDSTVLRLALK
jgi:hypothetical protein